MTEAIRPDAENRDLHLEPQIQFRMPRARRRSHASLEYVAPVRHAGAGVIGPDAKAEKALGVRFPEWLEGIAKDVEKGAYEVDDD